MRGFTFGFPPVQLAMKKIGSGQRGRGQDMCVAIAGEWDVKQKSCKLHAQWADIHGQSVAAPFSITFLHLSGCS